MAFDAATPTEVQSYEEFTGLIRGRWERLDPVMVAVKRYAGEQPGLEHVVLDARVAPFAAQNYKTIMNHVGSPSTEHVAPLAGNLGWFEAVLRSCAPEPTHVYAGIRNVGVPWEIPLGEALGSLGVLLRIKYYFGGWPMLDRCSFSEFATICRSILKALAGAARFVAANAGSVCNRLSGF